MLPLVEGFYFLPPTGGNFALAPCWANGFKQEADAGRFINSSKLMRRAGNSGSGRRDRIYCATSFEKGLAFILCRDRRVVHLLSSPPVFFFLHIPVYRSYHQFLHRFEVKTTYLGISGRAAVCLFSTRAMKKVFSSARHQPAPFTGRAATYDISAPPQDGTASVLHSVGWC